MTHDRDCTNVQGLLSKRSTPCQLHRRCTDTVAWRGAEGSNNKANAIEIAQGPLTKRNTPASCTEQKQKSPGTGDLCCFVVTYVRYQNTERKASDRSDRTPQVQLLFLNEYLITFLNEYIEFLVGRLAH